MATPFIGEISMFGGNFAPRQWAFCDGQALNISQNTALFTILGTTYGGNGTTTFALPELRGRLAIHHGSGPGLSPYVLGQLAGAENVTLNISQLPAHTHTIASAAGGAATTANPVGAYPATPAAGTPYATTGGAQMAAGDAATLGIAGSSVPHSNIMPFQVVNYIIALQGIFPARN